MEKLEKLEKLEIPTISFTEVTFLGNDASCDCVDAPHLEESPGNANDNYLAD